jgi:hypothetical protein
LLLDGAQHELLETLRAGNLKAYGKRNGNGEHQEIPVTVYMDCRNEVQWWDTIEGEYLGTKFTEVRFQTNDVRRLWPAQSPETAAASAEPVSASGDTIPAPQPGQSESHATAMNPQGAPAGGAALETNGTGRPTNSEVIHAALDALQQEGHRVKEMGSTPLAKLVAQRCGAKLNDPGWALRTVQDHIQAWRAGRRPKNRGRK